MLTRHKEIIYNNSIILFNWLAKVKSERTNEMHETKIVFSVPVKVL